MSVWTGVYVLALPLRRLVQLREAIIGRAVKAVESRALLRALMPERARFVHLARQRVGNEADAEDIVQHALARATDRAGSLADPTKARAWFYRILRRLIVDHLRGSVGDPLRHPSEVALETIPQPAVDGAGAACACGTRLLDEARPAYRTVLQRIDLDGEDASVVANELGISQENLHVRLHRARRSLRGDVQDYCGVTSHTSCLDCTCDGGQRCGDSGGCAPTRTAVTRSQRS